MSNPLLLSIITKMQTECVGEDPDGEQSLDFSWPASLLVFCYFSC